VNPADGWILFFILFFPVTLFPERIDRDAAAASSSLMVNI